MGGENISLLIETRGDANFPHLEQDVVDSNSFLQRTHGPFANERVVRYQSHSVLTPLRKKKKVVFFVNIVNILFDCAASFTAYIEFSRL